MLRILKVSGNSLTSILENGDYIIISKIPVVLNRLYRGDIVVFQNASFGVLVKKIEDINFTTNEIFVSGTHRDSVNSRILGAVNKKDIIGKMIFHIHHSNTK